MDFANERYARLYLRETTTYKRLRWEAQAVLPQMLKLVDRSGVFELGGLDPAEAVGLHLAKWPAEVVRPAVLDILDKGVLELRADCLVWPRYLEAQEASQSNRQRCAESRAKRRDLKRNESVLTQSASETTHGDTLTVPCRTKEEPSSLDEKTQETTVLVPHGTNGHNGHSVLPEEENPVTPEELVEGWNEVCAPLGLPKVREIKGSRRRKALERLREHPKPDFWLEVFGRFRGSLFLQGRSPSRDHPNWKPDFDWLIQNDVISTRIMEGKYG